LTSDFLLSLYVIMKQICITILVFTLIFSGCKKNDGPTLSGTITIDNRSYGATYYALGFCVPSGQKVSTLNNPSDVITILADFDTNYNVRKLFFNTYSLKNSFYRFGQYADAATASVVFKNLTSFSFPSWTGSGDTVKANQIWLFRTSVEKYAKIRIISTYTEKKTDMIYPYGECTFEWVYQPDGSLTFPGK
jgi:hypothetical protein